MALPSSLDSHLGYWLRLVSNQVSLQFARRVEEEGVTVAEWVVLRQLFDGVDSMPSRLAESLGLTRGAISKLADRLEAKGLIERREGEDPRSHRLALSAKGRALVPRLAGLADLNDAEFFDRLPIEERAALRRILHRLAEHHGLRAPPMA